MVTSYSACITALHCRKSTIPSDEQWPPAVPLAYAHPHTALKRGTIKLKEQEESEPRSNQQRGGARNSNSTPVTTKQASTVTSLTQSLTQLHLYTLMYIPVNWMKHLHRLNITTKFLYITVCPTSTGLRSIVSASQNSYETKLQVTSFSPPFCYQKLQSS